VLCLKLMKRATKMCIPRGMHIFVVIQTVV